MLVINMCPQEMLIRQLDCIYGIDQAEQSKIEAITDFSLKRLDKCFSRISAKYYLHNSGEALFDPLHTIQWGAFLYFISNSLWRENEKNAALCSKIYGINKMLLGADLYYEVELPDVWACDHPQGSVIGRAQYGDYFLFNQQCSVGNNRGLYPVLGNHITLMAGVSIFGDCHVGDYVIFSANSYIKDVDIPSCSIVFGQYPNYVIKPISVDDYYEYNNHYFKRRL